MATTPRGKCSICGRDNMALREPTKIQEAQGIGKTCSWCSALLRAGATVEHVEEKFLTNPPTWGTKKKAAEDPPPPIACQHRSIASRGAAEQCLICGKVRRRGGEWISPETAPPGFFTLVKAPLPAVGRQPGSITKTMIPCWTASDGTEFGEEINCLRHELELCIKTIERLTRKA